MSKKRRTIDGYAIMQSFDGDRTVIEVWDDPILAREEIGRAHV
jgi:hypothetical protein